MPSGTKVFKVALTGSTLEMTEITDRIVNAGEGVVLKSNSASITLASAASASATSYDGNSLLGTMSSITNPGNAYVLNKTNENGVGFYKLSTSGTIGANKAYLVGPVSAPEFFLFDQTTDINTLNVERETLNGEVYDLQGRRVERSTFNGQRSTLKKGLYIVIGKKVVIK